MSITFAEYARRTSDTAQHPGGIYAFLGLAGELGEFFVAQRRTAPGLLQPNIVEELGDIVWYSAQAFRELYGEDYYPDMFETAAFAAQAAVEYGGIPNSGHERNLKAMLDVVAAVEVCKKAVRAGKSLDLMPTAARATLLKAAVGALTFVFQQRQEVGYDLAEVMERNLTRLADRQGAGDIKALNRVDSELGW